MSVLWLERALVGDRVLDGVRVTVTEGRFTQVQSGLAADGAEILTGLTVPGLANCHSHAFHRALRGRVQRGGGTFWTWREDMYRLAGLLGPETYGELARLVFREMVATGVTSVGEFHYLHHGPDGTPYRDHAMELALVEAARAAGLRLTLLDTCYLTAGIGRPAEGVQRRFSDGDVEGYLARAAVLAAHLDTAEPLPLARAGMAIHSVRAVPSEALPAVAAQAHGRGLPLHVHLSEQPAENDACVAAYGLTPTALLDEAGVWGPLSTAVHATHLTPADIAVLGRTATLTCLCPTTERDLADGIGPARDLHLAGSPLTLGSDSHAVIDLFEEMRATELDERLRTGERGHWTPYELMAAATETGHRSLGFADVGRIETGFRADLVTLDLTSPRTAGAGSGLETAVYAAGGADVVSVYRDGRLVHHRDQVGELGRELARVIERVWDERRGNERGERA